MSPLLIDREKGVLAGAAAILTAALTALSSPALYVPGIVVTIALLVVGSREAAAAFNREPPPR